jgi:hypothetical protein
MTDRQKRSIRAFVAAPLVAPILWWALILIRRQSGATGPLDALGGLELITLVALPYTYGAALLVGLPVYLAIQRWSKLRAWHPFLAGAVLGALVFPQTDRLPITAEKILLGTALGTAVGVTFWWLWRPRGIT